MARSSDIEFFKRGASMSQQLAAQEEIYTQLAGTDKDISDSIAVLTYITDPKNIKLFETDPIKWTIGLLNILRQSAFATSEKTNEITKMGLQMPRTDVRAYDE